MPVNMPGDFRDPRLLNTIAGAAQSFAPPSGQPFRERISQWSPPSKNMDVSRAMIDPNRAIASTVMVQPPSTLDAILGNLSDAVAALGAHLSGQPPTVQRGLPISPAWNDTSILFDEVRRNAARRGKTRGEWQVSNVPINANGPTGRTSGGLW